jgi:glycosyltransferase involved in cell wall biosynthesis
VVDGINGLTIPCGNKDALAAAITKLYHNRDLLAAMGDAGRQRVEQNFTWEHYHQRLLEAYSLALQTKR